MTQPSSVDPKKKESKTATFFIDAQQKSQSLFFVSYKTQSELQSRFKDRYFIW